MGIFKIFRSSKRDSKDITIVPGMTRLVVVEKMNSRVLYQLWSAEEGYLALSFWVVRGAPEEVVRELYHELNANSVMPV